MGNTQGRSPEGKVDVSFSFRRENLLKYLKFKCDIDLLRRFCMTIISLLFDIATPQADAFDFLAL